MPLDSLPLAGVTAVGWGPDKLLHQVGLDQGRLRLVSAQDRYGTCYLPLLGDL